MSFLSYGLSFGSWNWIPILCSLVIFFHHKIKKKHLGLNFVLIFLEFMLPYFYQADLLSHTHVVQYTWMSTRYIISCCGGRPRGGTATVAERPVKSANMKYEPIPATMCFHRARPSLLTAIYAFYWLNILFQFTCKTCFLDFNNVDSANNPTTGIPYSAAP